MPDVSPAAAQKARAQWIAVLADGLDPITEPQRIRDEETENRNNPTFEKMAIAATRDDSSRGAQFSEIGMAYGRYQTKA